MIRLRVIEGEGPSGASDAPEEDPGLVYLCDDPDNEDAMSVVSDAKTQEELQEELTSLSRALEALEVESASGVLGGSPSQSSTVPSEQEQEHIVNLVSLYNSMGVKLMDARSYEDALSALRKAEALVEQASRWPGGSEAVRTRLMVITYNNLGCLFRRRSAPAEALLYLNRALAAGQGSPPNTRSAAATHLNICAAYTSLKRHREALGHAERAALMGLAAVGARLAAADSHAARRAVRDAAGVLSMAYHNAALAHERLGTLTEARRAFLARHARAASFSSASSGASARAPSRKPSGVMSRSRSATSVGRSASSLGAAKPALLKPPPATQKQVRL
ncbi:hypothetical protein QBZ16_003247 [Prototheca wickerhamii]|uniref:Uncharacterized protein n=1 Tax=Prototheca wickerhamii TaxID=3111 RepID=A0AAD9MIH1_PROWI|nr:hypothetical protein QBZ16_003247 [Prototheca wickerhamii]